MYLGARLASARINRLVACTAIALSLGFVGSASADGPITWVGGPSEVTVEATGPGGATVSFEWPTAYDDDGPVVVSCNPPDSLTIPITTPTSPMPGGCVTGNSGGPVFFNFPIFVVDTTPPSFDNNDPIGIFEATGPDGVAPSWTPPTATDLVDTDVEVTCSPAPGETLPLGISDTLCTAVDDYGNHAVRVFFAYVNDTTAPTIDPMPNIGPIEISDPSGEVVTWTDPSATDLVDTDVEVSCTPASGSLFSLGTQFVDCTATDDYNNNAFTSFQVEVVDTTGPVFSNIPNPGVIEATDHDGAYVDFNAPDANDAGSGNVGSYCNQNSGYYAVGQHTIDCEAFDSYSNYSYTSFSFEVVDTTPPTIHDVPTSPLQVEAPTSAGIAVDFDFILATDLYDQDVDVQCNPLSGSLFSPGTTQVSCTAEDDEGNESEAFFDVQVTLPNDTTPPVISGVPADFDALASSSSGGTVAYTTPTANDAIDGSVPINCTPSSGSFFSLGTTPVSCSAQDGSGNTSSASFNVSVFEPIHTTPQITAGAFHTCTLSAAGQVACFGHNVSGQLGPAPGVGYSNATPTAVPLGGPAVAVAAGQQHTCVLMASGDVKCFGWNSHGQLGSPINAGTGDANRDPITVDLDGDSAVSIAAGGNSTCVVLSSGALKCWGSNFYGQLGTPTNAGTGTPNPTPTTVDLGGELVSAVAVADTHTCALLASGDVSCWGRNDYGQLLRATGFGTTTPIPTPETIDFDGKAVEVDGGNGHTCVRLISGEVKCAGRNSYGQLANAAASGGFELVTAELAGDASLLGLGSTYSCFVLVDASVKCGGTNSYGEIASTSNLGSTTAGQPAQPADFGGPVFQVAAGWLHTCALLTDGTVRCVGHNGRGALGNPTNYGVDAAANPIALSTSQFLGDPVGPVISGMPIDVSTEATSSAGASVTYVEPTALDAVDGAVPVSCLPASGSTFAIGTTTVTCSAQDAAGRETSSTFDVTVEDTTGPAISGVPSDITEEATSPAGAVVSYPEPNAVDTVDGAVTVTCSPASGSTFAIATTEVTCQAEDSAGNPSSESFDVTVEDTTDPVFDAYPSFQTRDATGPNSALGYAMPTATDVADAEVEVVCTPEPTATYLIPDNAAVNEGVTCTATDDSGNEATLGFSVFLADYTAPALSDLPANIEVEATGASGAVVAFSPPTASDLVDGTLTASCAPTSGTTFAFGATRVLCEATDFSNNTAEHEFWVTVVDTTPPAFNSMLDDIVVEATGPDGAPVDITVAGATDLVDGPVPVFCSPGDGQFPVGSTIITCSTTDTRGNDDAYQFEVIVQDTTAPVISAVPADITVPANSAAGAEVSYASPTATDIVDGEVPVGCSPAPGSTFALGTTVVTCSATDSAAQSSTATFNVTVTPQVIDLATSFRIVSARKRGKRSLAVTVNVPAAGKLDVIATERRLRSSAGTSRRLKPGPGRAAYGRAILDLEKSGRATALLRLSPRAVRLIKQRRKPLLRVTAKFILPTGEVKHRVVFVRL